MARKYRARSIRSAIVRSEQGSCQWSMPSFIHAVQGHVLWRQGQRDQHREVTMAPCSGSKAAIVLRPAVREPRPATKKAAPGVRLERPGRTGTPIDCARIRKHVGGYNVVSERPRPDRDCGGSGSLGAALGGQPLRAALRGVARCGPAKADTGFAFFACASISLQ
jgi:hypothetical protein